MKIHYNNLVKHLAGALFVAALTFSGADAREVSPEQARRAVGHWLQKDRKPLGARMGANARAPRTFRDTAGAPLFYAVNLDGGGFVITSADDEIEPIIAFSDSGEFSADENNPLWALLHRDLPQRRDAVRARKFGLGAGGGAVANVMRGAGHRQRGMSFEKEAPAPEAQWAELEAEPDPLQVLGVTVSNISDRRVDPLVKSQWNQSNVGSKAVYNYYTPTPPPYGPPDIDGSLNNYVAGCVATAGAQVMRKWEWPQDAVTARTYQCKVNDVSRRLTMKGGTYAWNQMPLVPAETSLTEPQRQAIGKLLYDVGVASKMSYNEDGSGADLSDLTQALRDCFGYRSAIYADVDTARGLRSFYADCLNDAVLSNLDAGAPVIFSIYKYNGTEYDDGHAVVGDGYGYSASSVLYVHLNLGWGMDGSDTWYNLPNMDYGYNTVTGVVFNIFPQESGEIISGRVLTASGAPVSNVTVTVSNNEVTKQATTNDRGIYAVHVPSNGGYTVSASSGDNSASSFVTVGTSSSREAGNRWGNNLKLSAATAQLSANISGPSTATTGQSVAFTASVSGGIPSFTYMWYDNDNLRLANTAGTASLTFSTTGVHIVKVKVTDRNNNTAEVSHTVTVSAASSTVTLDAALSTDSTQSWNWTNTSGNNANWFGQTGISHDGVSAGQSGVIADNQKTSMQTTVSGPGKVSFWWKVSSESGYDFLRFYVDGVEQTKISGRQAWTRREFTISGTGSHILKWEYTKDGSLSRGDDTGWVDQVVWTPGGVAAAALTVTPESKSVAAAASSFNVSVSGNVAWSVSKNAAWLTVTPATGNNNGTLTVRCAANYNLAARTGAVTVSGGGITRTISVTQAADTWDVAALAGKGVKLTATVAVPKGVKLLKGTKAVYTWKRDGVTVASGTAKTFTAKDSGTYTLTLSYITADWRQYSQTQNFGKLKLFAQLKTATLTMAQTTNTITDVALRGTSVVSGESLRLTVSVGTAGDGAAGPFRYVWYCGKTVVRTQDSTSATDTFVTPAYGDKAVGYKCVVELVARDLKNKPLGTAKSKELKAKIILPPSAVTLTASASPVKENGTLTLSASAKGTSALLFTWYKNGRQIATGSAKKFTKKPVTVSDAGTYYVVVSQDKTSRRAQSASVVVNIQRADGTVVQGNGGVPPPPAALMAGALPAATTDSRAAANNGAGILNLAPLTLSAGDVLTLSGTAPREYLILSETQHTTGAYRYEWRDNLTATFQDADAETQLTLRFTTVDGGVYELTVSGSASETGAFELRKQQGNQ